MLGVAVGRKGAKSSPLNVGGGGGGGFLYTPLNTINILHENFVADDI